MLRRVILGVFAATVFGAGAHAAVIPNAIEINPGDVGATFQVSDTFTVEAGDIVDNTIDIVWSDMKHVEIFQGSYAIGIVSPGLAGVNYEAYLSDEFGNMIANTLVSGTASSSGFGGGDLQLSDGLIFHDIHFTFLDPPLNIPFDAEVAVIGLQGTPDALVGEWTPVPVPSTLLLMVVGLAGLGFARRTKA